MNQGHGHVFPRPDGVKARCGGPAICHVCAIDLGRKNAQESIAAAEQRPSKKQLAPCPHGHAPDLCRLCMRAEIEKLNADLAYLRRATGAWGEIPTHEPNASKSRALELAAMDPEWLGMSERREVLQLLRQFATAHEPGLKLPDDQRELLVTTARDAGFSDYQWKAMFYEQGPYDVTFPCFTTKKFIALLLERLQPSPPPGDG